MTNPYDPAEQLLSQITVLENKITEILTRSLNRDTVEIKRYRKFIRDKKLLLCKLNKLHRDI